MRRIFVATLGVGLLLCGGPRSGAVEGAATRLVVRAVSQGAKIIGDQVGGARITVRDAATGEVLATGLQKGGSGDTARIMGRETGAAGPVYDTPGAASFLATLRLTRPTRVEVAAEGPLGFPQNIQRASATVLLVPGQDVLGEGLILTIHSYAMGLLAPAEGATAPAGEALPVRATVRMA